MAQPRPRGGPCRDAARRLDTALELRERALETAALEVLTDLHRECPSPRVRAQMGLAAQGLSRWVEARAHLVEALAAEDDPWIRRVRPQLVAALGLIDAQLAEVEPESDSPETALIVDGRAVGTLPLMSPVRVVPGRHTAEFRAPGRLPLAQAFEVAAGGRWTPRVVLPLETPVAVPVVPRTEPSRDATTPWWTRRRVVGVSLAGTGVVLSLVALVQWRAAAEQADLSRYASPSRSDEYGAWWRFHASVNPMGAQDVGAVCDAAAGSDHPDAGQVRGLCDDNTSLRVQQWVFGLAGLGLVATGAVLTLRNPRSAESARTVVPQVTGGWLPGARAGQLTARWVF